MKRSMMVTVLCLICTIMIKSQITDAGKRWDFPVKPGTEEWKRLDSYWDFVAVSQIPEDVLTALPTDELAEICLEYPLLLSIVFSNNYDESIENFLAHFNGAGELFKRGDASDALLKQYQAKMQDLSFLNEIPLGVEAGFFVFNIAAQELLLSRCIIRADKNREGYREIMQHLISSYEEKLLYQDAFYGEPFNINLYARAKTLIKTGAKILEQIPQRENNPVFRKGIADEQTKKIINDLSYQFIKK